MGNPEQPCGNCGATMNAADAHCGNCGRPNPGHTASKTLFGYQAPKEGAWATSQQPEARVPEGQDQAAPAASPAPAAPSPQEQQWRGQEETTQPQPPSSEAEEYIDPLASLAQRLPQSEPGTLFGIPMATLRDQVFEKRMLYLCGIALVVAAFLPWGFSPLIFAWSEYSPTFEFFVLPLIVGGSYLLVAAAPSHIKEKVPPLLLKWLPFLCSFFGLGVVGIGGFMLQMFGGATGALSWGLPLLVFGLLVRLNDPRDPYARYIIGVGAAISFVFLLSSLKWLFSFDVPVLVIIHNLTTVAVMLVATACIGLVVPPEKVPQLRSIDKFAPLMTAILLAWPLLSVLLFVLGGIVEGQVMMSILSGGHVLLFNIAYFGVLLITSPEAYDEIKVIVANNQAAAREAYEQGLQSGDHQQAPRQGQGENYPPPNGQ